MSKNRVWIEDGETGPGQPPAPSTEPYHPPPEQDLGGGDICSLEQEASTEDDAPLD